MSSGKLAAVILAVGFCLALGATSHAEDVANAKETTVIARGIGTTADLAKRDALMNAVYMAAGSCVDSQTLIVNDQIIKEQVLQASGSYVHRHEVLKEAARREDGLWEIAIKAEIRGGQLQERLKKVTIRGANVDAKDKAAEAVTKIQNAREGAPILQSTLDGILPQLLVVRLVNDKGEATQKIQPKVVIKDDGRLDCTWNVEIYFDLKAFYETLVPQLDRVLTAVAAQSGGPVQSQCEKVEGKTQITGYPIFDARTWRGGEPAKPSGDQPFAYFLLSTGRAESGGTERFQWYLLEGIDYLKSLGVLWKPNLEVSLNVQFLAEDGTVVWKESMSPWENGLYQNTPGRSHTSTFWPYYLAPMIVGPSTSGTPYVILSPRFARQDSGYVSPVYQAVHGNNAVYAPSSRGGCDVIVKSFTTSLASGDLERIKQVRFHFEGNSLATDR